MRHFRWRTLLRRVSRAKSSSGSRHRPRFFSTNSRFPKWNPNWKIFALSSAAIGGSLLALTAFGYSILHADIHPIKATQDAILRALLRGLSGKYGGLLQEQSIRILSQMSRFRTVSLDFVDGGILDAIASCLDTSSQSPWTQMMLMSILTNLCKADQTRVLAHSRIISHVRALTSSNDRHTVRVVASFFCSILESADATASSRFIRSIRLAAFVDLIERAELYHELSKTLKQTLTLSLAQLSTAESPTKYEDEPFDFIYLLNLLVKDSSNKEKTYIARALANTLGYEKVSSAEMAAQTGTMVDPEAVSTDSAGKQEYLADVLVLLKKLGSTEGEQLPSDLRSQLARIITNLAVVGGSSMKRQLCDEMWHKELLQWALSDESDLLLRIASTAALANLASVSLPDTAVIKRILSIITTSDQRDSRLMQQTMRLCLAAAEQQPEQIVSIGLLPEFVKMASSKSSDVKGPSRALALASLASLVKVPSVTDELLSDGSSLDPFWKLLIQSAQHDADSSVRREAVRIIANLCLLDSKRVKAKGGVEQVLKECLQSESDAMVVREVIRAQASLASSELKGQARYDEGIFLLHPQPVKNGEKQSSKAMEPAVDIVFVHGVAGHSLWTWRAGPAKPDGSGEICWPRDWVPKDFPNSRIITVSYEVYLSRWEGSAVPLTQQSLTILKKLKLANIGSRPVIFIVHSFGGLVVKDMLRYAATSKEFKPVRDQTLGIFFFSSPHLGSSLTELTHLIGGYADTLYRSTPAVNDLKPKNQYLRDLNDEFCTYGPSIATFSTGEDESCTLTAQGNKYICYNVVSDESARFAPTGPCQCEHRFLKLPYDHRGVCKPDSKSDLRYQLVVDFIREQLARKDPKLLAAVTQPK